MELTGMTEKQVDVCIAGLATLMQQSAKVACTTAAESMLASSEVVVASPIDALGTMVSSWKASVSSKLMPYVKNIFTTAASTVASPLGVEATPSESVLGDVEQSLTAFANDLYDAGQLAIMVGWQDGETVMAMADRVTSVPKVKEKKIYSVAQTLVTTAVNGGEWSQLMAISAKFSTITLKEWVATHDSHTRPTHWAADGQIVPLQQKFMVGDALLDFPGDPFGDLDEIANCRCTTKYNSEIPGQNSTTQTSPDALSADSSVDTTEQISASAATNPNWNSSDHPRGKNGKFIKKGAGSYSAIVKIAKNGKNFSSWTKSDQKDFVDNVPSITPDQWDELTTDQKHDIEIAVDDALDEGTPGSASAQSYLNDLSMMDSFGSDDDEDADLFDPETPLPGKTAAEVHNAIDTAYGDGDITKEQKDKLKSLVKSGVSPDDVQEALDEDVLGGESSAPAAPSTPTIHSKIYDAFYGDQITEAQNEELLDALTDGDDATLIENKLNDMIAVNSGVNTPTASAPATGAPIITGTPKPIKITHGLIHAKYAPGTTVAVDEKGNKIVWNGSSYDIIGPNGDPVATNIKKSKLYALLNTYNADAQWHEPGAQPVAVTHASPLDAAPDPEPIPHPVNPTASFPGTSSVDDALDDAFGPTNTGMAPATVDPLSLGKLPNDTSAEILDSLNKLHEVGSVDDKDYKELVTAVKGGKLFMGKMVVGMHNTKVGAASFVVPSTDNGLIHNPDLDEPTMPVGTSISANDVIDGTAGFAPGEVHATGTNSWGEAWSVAPAPGGNVMIQMDGVNGATVMSYPDFVSYSVENQIEWESNDGSTSIFPKAGIAAKSAPAKKVTPGAGAAYAAKKAAAAAMPTPAPTGPINAVTSTPTADDVSQAKQAEFYKHFKAENVSPAWSGAKIYKSLQAAKLKMASDPQFANMSDEELLKILDKQHNIAKATNVKAYSTKTKEWLKTPQGQKAFAELNPAIATPPAGVAKKIAGKAAKKVAAPAVDPLGDTAIPAHLTPADRASIYTQFKGTGYGTYLNDSKPEEIYWNAQQLAKTHNLTPGQVLAIIDEEGAKKFGVANANSFQNKVSAWSKTPSGKAKVAEIQDGSWTPAIAAKKTAAKKAKKTYGGYGGYGGSSGGSSSYTQTHPASTPLNQKVQDVDQAVPPFDESKTAADFPVISNAQAAELWDDMIDQSGEPFKAKQKASLKHYTTNAGFSSMNDYLRGKTGATDATQNHINNAQAGMRPVTRDIVLHRGNGTFVDGAGRPWTNYEEISTYVGTNLHQEAFFSASVGGKADFGGSIMMEIEVPKGTPAAYVKAFSAYEHSESEMLLAANMEYRIISVKKQGYQTVVRMRVVAKGSA